MVRCVLHAHRRARLGREEVENRRAVHAVRHRHAEECEDGRRHGVHAPRGAFAAGAHAGPGDRVDAGGLVRTREAVVLEVDERPARA